MNGHTASVVVAVLFDITWRSAAIMGAALVLERMHRGTFPARRRDVWSAAFASTLVMIGVSVAIGVRRLTSGEPVYSRIASVAPDVHIAIPARATSAAGWQIALIGLAAGGVAVALTRAIVGRWRARTVVRRSAVTADLALQDTVNELAADVGLRRVPALLQSSCVSSAAVFRYWRPVIIVSPSAAHWSEERRQQVLAHELAHITAHDMLFAKVADVVRALVWWNPAVLFAERRLSAFQEFACDARVIARGAPRASYAETLLDLASHRHEDSSPASTVPELGATRAPLAARVEALLRPADDQHERSTWWTRPAALVAMTVIGLLPLRPAAMHASKGHVVYRRQAGDTSSAPPFVKLTRDASGRLVMTIVNSSA